MKDVTFKLITWFVVVILLGIGATIGWHAKPDKIKEVEVVKTVTKTVYPEPVEIIKEKIVKVPVDRIIYRDTPADTVKIKEYIQNDSVNVRWESKFYSDPKYDLWISGIMPQVDSINIYSETQIFREVEYKDRLEFGPYVSGTFGNNISLISAGLELSIPYRRWEFSVNGGYGIQTNLENSQGWVAGARIKYNIFNR